MLALSIRQPWAWLILHGGKDIENRDWPTKFRGRVLVHAAKGMTRDEWEGAWIHAHGQQHRVIDITPPAAPAEEPREEPPRRGLMRLLWGGR